ncbi:hypothetical protein [Paraliomyxa miuraensis]|uniref:hypothetical protein n=1 Tax=Paraliomyxa miuraensis TaxID=376150 RepID=UPI0022577FCA|nr:hypothetical protein [Paraliomyxa miuraensis]MCX4239082.1 hypothetical protein [Paraliomyxa miuraensis]
MATRDARTSRGRSRAKDARPGLDLLDFFLTRRAASFPEPPPTPLYRTWRGRGPSDLVDPVIAEQIEQLEAIGEQLTRRGPLDLLLRIRTRANRRLATLLRRGGRDDERT